MATDRLQQGRILRAKGFSARTRRGRAGRRVSLRRWARKRGAVARPASAPGREAGWPTGRRRPQEAARRKEGAVARPASAPGGGGSEARVASAAADRGAPRYRAGSKHRAATGLDQLPQRGRGVTAAKPPDTAHSPPG